MNNNDLTHFLFTELQLTADLPLTLYFLEKGADQDDDTKPLSDFNKDIQGDIFTVKCYKNITRFF